MYLIIEFMSRREPVYVRPEGFVRRHRWAEKLGRKSW